MSKKEVFQPGRCCKGYIGGKMKEKLCPKCGHDYIMHDLRKSCCYTEDCSCSGWDVGPTELSEFPTYIQNMLTRMSDKGYDISGSIVPTNTIGTFLDIKILNRGNKGISVNVMQKIVAHEHLFWIATSGKGLVFEYYFSFHTMI